MTAEAQVLTAIIDFKEAAQKHRQWCNVPKSWHNQLRNEAIQIANNLLKTSPNLQLKQDMIQQAFLEVVEDLEAA